MIDKSLLTEVATELRLQQTELIEKDLLLQGLLLELSQAEHFRENYCFKGGTCLTKAYFGYYRFSEDLDFTWIHQERFEKLSNIKIQKALSSELKTLFELFVGIAKKMGLDFQPDRKNSRYVNITGRNRFVSFKFWYTPTENTEPTFVKIQLNMLEKLAHKPIQQTIHAISKNNDLAYLYPQHGRLAITPTNFLSYDLQEIAAEKIRALLTRRGFKPRDLIDLYYLAKHQIAIEKSTELALKKIEFMNKFERFKQNLLAKQSIENIKWETEQPLLIQPLPTDFEEFAKKAMPKLNSILAKAQKRATQKNTNESKK